MTLDRHGSASDQALDNIKTAWQAAVTGFLGTASPDQIDAAAASLRGRGFTEVAEQLPGGSSSRLTADADSNAGSTPERQVAAQTSSELTTLEQDPLVAGLVQALTMTIPRAEAERLLKQPNMTPETAWEVIGALVPRRGVAAMTGYVVREMLEDPGEDYQFWLPASRGEDASERLGQDEQPPQQGRPRGQPARGQPAADRITRLVESFLPDQNTPFRGFEGPAPHLRITSRGDGPRDGVHILPNQLAHESRQAFDWLQEKLGGPQEVNDMVRALVVGYVSVTGQEEVGLRGLAEAWRDAAASDRSVSLLNRPMPPLDGEVLVKLGKVVFNDPKFGLLGHLQALVAVDIPKAGFRGILHPAADLNYVSRWIAPASEDMGQMRGLATSSPSLEQIQKSPWYLEHLRTAQRAYDGATDGDGWQQSPWHGSDDPGFKNTLAAREAFWLALWSAGLKENARENLLLLEEQHWSDAVRFAPGLERIDFAAGFIEHHDHMRQVLPQAIVEYESVLGLRLVKTIAAYLGDKTFSGDALRQKLRESLLLFEHPDALRLYSESPEFERHAAKIATDVLLKQVPDVTTPWATAELRKQAELIAKSLAARAGDNQGNDWLRQLETLATSYADSVRAQRSDLLLRARELQAKGSRILINLDSLLGERGLTLRDPSALTAESLLGAVAERFGRHGIQVTPRFDSGPAQVVFVVKPADPLTGASYTETPPVVQPDPLTGAADAKTSTFPDSIWFIMDRLITSLKDAGYVGKWEFETAPSDGAGAATVIYKQPEQQQQQGSGEDRMSNATRPTLGRGLFLHNLTDRNHLRASDSDNSISVKRDKLGIEVKPVFDHLVRDLGGEASLNRMLNALVMDSHGEFGLPALSRAWLAGADESAGRRWPALTGTRLLQLAQVLFNDEGASTLGAMAALMGVSGPKYRGILHPSSDLKAIRESADDETRVARDQFWRMLAARGLDMQALERIMNRSLPADQGIQLLGASSSNKSGSAAIQWALAVSELPYLGNLNFAALFGGEGARRARSDSVQAIPTELDIPVLQRRMQAQSAAEKVFSDPGLRASLSHHLFASGPEQLLADATLRAAAVHVVTERLLAGSDVDLPGIVEELRGDVNGAAMQSSSDTSDAAFFAQLEDLAMSKAPIVAVQRQLLLVSARYRQMEKHRVLLEDVARHLARDDTPFRGGDGPETSTFRGALIAILGEVGIRARMEPATQDHPERIIVAPSASAPTGGAASPSVSEKMALVINALAGVGYKMEWTFDDSEPAL